MGSTHQVTMTNSPRPSTSSMVSFPQHCSVKQVRRRCDQDIHLKEWNFFLNRIMKILVVSHYPISLIKWGHLHHYKFITLVWHSSQSIRLNGLYIHVSKHESEANCQPFWSLYRHKAWWLLVILSPPSTISPL